MTALQKPGDTVVDPQHLSKVGVCGMPGQAAAWQWLLRDSWVVIQTQGLCGPWPADSLSWPPLGTSSAHISSAHAGGISLSAGGTGWPGLKGWRGQCEGW